MKSLKTSVNIKIVIFSLALVFSFSCKTRQQQNQEDDGELSAARSLEAKPWTKIGSMEFHMDGPPTDNSERYKDDYKKLRSFSVSNRDSDCALAKKQRYPTFKAFFGPPSTLLSKEEYAKVEPLLENVTNFSERIANYFKGKYERPRPYNVDSAIAPCITKVEGNKSYPSSHAVVAYVDACILAEIFSDRAQDIMEYGMYLGNLRAIVGVHHPSDVEAGQTLGKDICARLMGDPSFNLDLQEILR